MATARISKGDNAPEGDVTITPAVGEQFVLSDGGSYETENQDQVASLQGSAASGLVKVEYAESSEDARAAEEEEKEVRKAARKRAKEIEKGVPLTDLTEVPGTPQGDPEAGHARDDQEAGN